MQVSPERTLHPAAHRRRTRRGARRPWERRERLAGGGFVASGPRTVVPRDVALNAGLENGPVTEPLGLRLHIWRSK